MKRLGIGGILLAHAAWATCISGTCDIAIVTSADYSVATVPSISPFTGTNYANYFDGRITSAVIPASGNAYFIQSAAGAIALQNNGGNLALFFVFNNNAGVGVNIPSGVTDFLFRAQWDIAHSLETIEVWKYDGTNYASATAGITTNNISWAGAIDLGYTGSNFGSSVRIAYLRWYSGVLPMGSPPPTSGGGPGTLADWEFNNNANDSVNGINWASWTGTTPSYYDTPQYPPTAVVTNPPLTTRAGSTISLNGANSYTGAGGANYVWQQTSFVPLLDTSGNPQTSRTQTIWSGENTSTSTATLPLAGTYYLNLTVTDSTGASNTSAFKVGVVATDANNIIVVPDPKMAFLLGQMVYWGNSPWPWYDTVNKGDADIYYGPGGLPATVPFHRTASGSTGTVLVTNGSTSVTGTGTHFTTDFACNSTDSIVVYYVLANSQTGARGYTVVSCSDDTHMVINQWNTSSTLGYDASATQSGRSYDQTGIPGGGTALSIELTNWVHSGGAGWNYYDVVLATYRLYYRTGIDDYLTDARHLADLWYTYPLDGGRAYNNGDYGVPGARSAGLLGMMARALDGKSGMWLDSAATGAPSSVSGIKGITDTLYSLYITTYFSSPYDLGDMVDARESGYASWFETAYYFTHDSSYYANAKNAVLGGNSFQSRYHAGYGLTTNADPTSASGGQTLSGYAGPDYQGSFWFNAFPLKAIRAFIQASTVSGDKTAALTLLENATDDFIAGHYIKGTAQELSFSSFYTSCDAAHMPQGNNQAPYPTGTVTVTTGTNVTGSASNFQASSGGYPLFFNDGNDLLGVQVGTTGYQMLPIPASGVTSNTALTTTTSFGSNLSGLLWGSGIKCANGVSLGANYPQNPFASSDFGPPYSSAALIGQFINPPTYSMSGRTVAEPVNEVNGFLYVQTGLAKYKNQGDALAAASYGCGSTSSGCIPGHTTVTGGGPSADTGAGNFADLYVYSPPSNNAAQGKEFGLNAGSGMADTYLSARLGGLAPEVTRTIQVGYNLGSADHVDISTTLPDTTVVTTVCSTNPCNVIASAREASAVLTFAYKTSGGAVLRSTSLPWQMVVQ